MKLTLDTTDIRARLAHSLMTSGDIPWMKELEKQGKNVFIVVRKNSHGKIEAEIEVRDYDWSKHKEEIKKVELDNSANEGYPKYKPYSWK